MAYTNIDNEIIRSDLKPITKIVLITILSYYNKDNGYSYPTQKRLMADTCIKDRKTLQKAIKELEEEGYIRKEAFRGSRNKYYIL